MADNVIEVDFAPKLSALQRVDNALRELAEIRVESAAATRDAKRYNNWERRVLFARIRRLREELRAERANQFDDDDVYTAAVEEIQGTGREVAAKAVAARLLKYPTHSAAIRVGHAFSRLERAGRVRRVAPSGSSSGYRWLVEGERNA